MSHLSFFHSPPLYIDIAWGICQVSLTMQNALNAIPRLGRSPKNKGGGLTS